MLLDRLGGAPREGETVRRSVEYSAARIVKVIWARDPNRVEPGLPDVPDHKCGEDPGSEDVHQNGHCIPGLG